MLRIKKLDTFTQLCKALKGTAEKSKNPFYRELGDKLGISETECRINSTWEGILSSECMCNGYSVEGDNFVWVVFLDWRTVYNSRTIKRLEELGVVTYEN